MKKLTKLLTAALLAAAIACSSLSVMAAAPAVTQTAAADKNANAFKADAPTVKGIHNTQNGIRVEWKKVKNVKYFAVYRKVGKGDYKLLRTTDKTYIVDKQVKAGTAYSYKVRCVDKKGNFLSKRSKEALMYRVAAPTLTLVEANDGKTYAKVRIAAADKAEGYEIAYSKSVTFKDAKTKAVDAFKTKTKSVRISGLDKDEAYFMQACSYIKVGKVKYYSAPGKVVLSVKIN